MREKLSNNYTFRLCPVCEYFCNTEEPDKYCSICGAELIDTCPECGKPITNPYAHFCKFCGKSYPNRNKKSNNKNN